VLRRDRVFDEGIAMTTKLRILIAITAAPLLAAPTCGQSAAPSGDQQICQDAVDYLETECGIASGSASQGCTARDECVARCILDASCEAITGADPAAAQSFETCSNACDDASGSGGTNTPGCHPCADFLNNVATYEEVCESGQQLLDEWAACICYGLCEAACFTHCQGLDPDPGCSDCIATSCVAQTQACQADQ
jgi:hypothetical protein